MTRLLRHQRWQHAVGQGSFHSAMVEVGVSDPFRYVYDCGATPKGRLPEQARVFRQTLQNERKLDLLCVSHLHEDHVNGLVDLFGKPTTLDVALVILPYLTPIERLLLAWVERPNGTKAGDAYVAMLADPVAWFMSRGAKKVAVVTRARIENEEGLVAPPDGSFPGPDAHDPIECVLPQTPDPSRITLGDPMLGAATEIDHKHPVVLKAGAAPFWMLVTYVDTSALKLPELATALAVRLGISELDLAKRIGDPNSLADLVTNNAHRKHVAASYRQACDANINISSMSLFSGPLPRPVDGEYASLRYVLDLKPADLDRWRVHYDRSKRRLGWLATGDAPLGTGTPHKAKALASHFNWGGRSLLDELATLILPHHGARSDFPEELLVAIKPELALVSAGNHSKYNHPHPHVIESALRAEIPFAAITDSWADGVRDVVNIYRRAP